MPRKRNTAAKAARKAAVPPTPVRRSLRLRSVSLAPERAGVEGAGEGTALVESGVGSRGRLRDKPARRVVGQQDGVVEDTREAGLGRELVGIGYAGSESEGQSEGSTAGKAKAGKRKAPTAKAKPKKTKAEPGRRSKRAKVVPERFEVVEEETEPAERTGKAPTPSATTTGPLVGASTAMDTTQENPSTTRSLTEAWEHSAQAQVEEPVAIDPITSTLDHNPAALPRATSITQACRFAAKPRSSSSTPPTLNEPSLLLQTPGDRGQAGRCKRSGNVAVSERGTPVTTVATPFPFLPWATPVPRGFRFGATRPEDDVEMADMAAVEIELDIDVGSSVTGSASCLVPSSVIPDTRQRMPRTPGSAGTVYGTPLSHNIEDEDMYSTSRLVNPFAPRTLSVLHAPLTQHLAPAPRQSYSASESEYGTPLSSYGTQDTSTASQLLPAAPAATPSKPSATPHRRTPRTCPTSTSKYATPLPLATPGRTAGLFGTPLGDIDENAPLAAEPQSPCPKDRLAFRKNMKLTGKPKVVPPSPDVSSATPSRYMTVDLPDHLRARVAALRAAAGLEPHIPLRVRAGSLLYGDEETEVYAPYTVV